MKNSLVQKPLSVKKSPIHGYGIFAEANIHPNEIIEECYVLTSDDKNFDFYNYSFDIKNKHGLPLGFGAIYNHSNQSNANYTYDENTNLLVFSAKRFIAKGEEIFVHYGEDWFSSRETTCKEISLLTRYWRYFKGLPLRATFATSVIFALIHLLKYVVNLGYR